MDLSFSTQGCPQYTIERAIESAKQYGYQGISLRTVRGESFLPKLKEFSIGNYLPRLGTSRWLTFEWGKGWHPKLAELEVAFRRFVGYRKDLLSLIQ